ncbi:MAG: SulP family sulfate permease [Arenicella sp.]|jgi:SulP family sulfate permease
MTSNELSTTKTASSPAKKPFKVLPAAMIGLIAGIDNIVAALAMGALLFAGSLSSGMGLGVGVVLLGGALISVIVALFSKLPNSVALVQETTIAVLSAAIIGISIQSIGNAETKIATAIVIIGASSIVTGVLFWITGRFKLGNVVRFLPYPVIAGFLAGSGWLLIDGAVSVISGHTIGLDFLLSLRNLDVLLRLIPAIVFTFVMFAALARSDHPATMPVVMLIFIILFYSVSHLLELPSAMSRELGHLPKMNESGQVDLPSPALLGSVDWWAVLNAWPSFLVIAGLSMIGLLLNLSGLELALGRDIDVNAELQSSGIANIASGAVGGPSGFVGLSMTVLAEKMGVVGRSAGIATAVVMLLGLFAAGSLVFQVPVFLTAGFILFLGIELVKEWFIDTRHRMPLSEWATVAIILFTVAVVGFLQGLATGLLVSSAVFVFKYSRLPVVRLRATGVERRSTVDRSPSAIKFLSDHGECIEVVQLQGYLFFGTADRIVNLVRDRLEDSDKVKVRMFILDFQNVSGTDSAAVTCFIKIQRLVELNHVKLVFTCLPQDLLRNLTLAGIKFGADNSMSLHIDLDHALEQAEEFVLDGRDNPDGDTSLLHHLSFAIGPHPRLPELIEQMTHLQLQPEDVLIKQGEQADDIYFVSTGQVRVQITLANGNTMRVRTMLSGAIVGEIAFYLGQQRSADVIVDTASDIYRISSEDIVRLERTDAELASLVHKLLASNLSEKLAVANKIIQLTQS